MNTNLGRYNLIGVLGRGGMGVVYQAFESSLNRFVAVKMLAESLAGDEGARERFLREARSMAALNNPHIIQIYFIGDDAGQTFFVMEFVDGESLSSLLKREHRLKPEQAARIIYQTAQGLASAHDKGVIHRDIKPANLMITKHGGLKIADFGIALAARDFSKKLTSSGEFVGTPGYLSPEVCLSKPVDQRSDIFSLGIVLFECITGHMPFTDESPLGLMLEVVKAEIPDVCQLNAEVDPEIARILGKMIAKDPIDRYQSCHELVDDLAKHPLVAKGGPIGLATNPAVLEPLRRATNGSIRAIAPIASSLKVANSARRDAPTARQAGVLIESRTLLPRKVRVRNVLRSRRYWVAAAALGFAAAASAWAIRSDTSFSAPPIGSSLAAPTTSPSKSTQTTSEGISNETPDSIVATSTTVSRNEALNISGMGAAEDPTDPMRVKDAPDNPVGTVTAGPSEAFNSPHASIYVGPATGAALTRIATFASPAGLMSFRQQQIANAHSLASLARTI